METEEIKNIVIAAVALAIAFAIAFEGGILGFIKLTPQQMGIMIILSVITVSVSFILHELGHRQVCRRFGAYAEFRKWNIGLGLALLGSLAGFVFAAPGAVMIHPRADLWGKFTALTKKKLGLISLAGPAINLVLAGIFAGIYFLVYPSEIAMLGFAINAWLAFFNLLPIPPLDGFKIFVWDKRIWLVITAIAGIGVFVGI